MAVPNHDPLKTGALNAILRQVAEHLDKTKEDILKELFS